MKIFKHNYNIPTFLVGKKSTCPDNNDYDGLLKASLASKLSSKN